MFRDIKSWNYACSIEDGQTLDELIKELHEVSNTYGGDCKICLLMPGSVVTLIHDSDGNQLLVLPE